MGIRHRHHHRSGRRGGVFLATGAIVGLLLMSPAGAHVTDSIGHIVNHVKDAVLPITSKELGNVSFRAENVLVLGGAAANGQYDQEGVQVFCGRGQIALSWNGYWPNADIEAGAGGSDDLELFITQARAVVDDVRQGFEIWAGNDTADDQTFAAEVRCLAR